MFERHPKSSGPYSPYSAPFVQTYVVPEVQTVQTHFIKHHVYKFVHYYPHTHSFQNNHHAHVHKRWKPADAKSHLPGYPFN